MREKEIPKAPSQVKSEVVDNRRWLSDHLRNSPIPNDELIRNLSLYTVPTDLQKILFLNEMYETMMTTHGVIMEFGCRWGNNLATFQNLRSIHEPFNHNRKIIGFDTFSGFAGISNKDENNLLSKDVLRTHGLTVSESWEKQLDTILRLKEKESPVEGKKKFELVKGDIRNTLPDYLIQNPQTLISLAYFDMDLYEPTLAALKSISNHLTKGSVLVFDELNNEYYPGESIALNEVLGFKNIRIQRSQFCHMQSYIILE